ncbi:unnamed protein product [Pleuronectes platessa]|uniref:Uncharacterized protein n=1 Tax=Pleuronectes platessa TaxID=8262 RepID=A0A9N7URS0_PLEPL|nr:unnamed protein product [Pleuronectes platessa]
MSPNTSPRSIHIRASRFHVFFSSLLLSSLMECQGLTDTPAARLHGNAVAFFTCPLENDSKAYKNTQIGSKALYLSKRGFGPAVYSQSVTLHCPAHTSPLPLCPVPPPFSCCLSLRTQSAVSTGRPIIVLGSTQQEDEWRSGMDRDGKTD